MENVEKPSDTSTAASDAEKSKPELYVDKLKRHPFVATIILATAIFTGLAALIKSNETISEWIGSLDPCSNPVVDERPIKCLEE